MVRYLLPSVESTLQLDRRCPHCHRPNGRIHSALGYRAIRDLKVSAIPQRRMRCPWCGMTWTLRAEGVNGGCQRSRRLVGMGVLLYMMGLSYRRVEEALAAEGCPSGKSSVERDVKAAGEEARLRHREARQFPVRVLGVDGTGAAMAGKDAGVLFLVGLEGGGHLIGLAPLHEEQTQKVRDHVAKVMAAVGAKELRSDEHSVYERIVPEAQHRICLAHWAKSKGKRAYDLHRQAVAEGRPLEAATMWQLLQLLRKRPRPPTVPEELTGMVVRYINARKGLPWKVNQLLQHVERTWERVSDDPVDPTNNATERIIGLTFKIRSKTMRGFKALHKVLAHPYLSSFLRGQGGICDLREVI
ncbi:MAG: hypothetical protein MUP64_08220 [Anaerolineae bacterium]|nr:hypothetical protein [Anaerolineae bacterium]